MKVTERTAFKIEKVLQKIDYISSEYTLIHLDFKNITYQHNSCNAIITKTLGYFLQNHGCSNGKCKYELLIKNNGKDFVRKRNKKSHDTREANGNPGYDKASETWHNKPQKELERIAEQKHNTKLNSIDEGGLNAYDRAAIANKKSKLNNHKDENYNNSEKRIKTCNSKYGMGSNGKAISKGLLKKSEEEWKKTIQKRQNTNLKLHGSVNAYNDKKVKETNQKNLGVDYPSQCQEIKAKVQKTNFTKYYNEKLLNFTHVEILFTLEEYQGNLKPYTFLCNTCNQEFSFVLRDGKIPRCTHCYPPQYNQSKAENEIKDWLRQININILPNERFYYDGKKYHELDVYLPEKNIGVEFNGIYYHSELSGNKDSKYHLTKTNFFKKKNIQVLHIFDNEWINKKEIVKSIILSKLGIYQNKIFARKCELKEISNKQAVNFYEQNHLQGKINSKVNIGLFFNNELVQCVSFSKVRFNKKSKEQYEYELTRSATILNTTIVGGFSKCLKYFVNNYSNSIITYADKRISIGNVYSNNNFKLLHESTPNYFYTDDYQNLYSRHQFQHHKLKDILENYNEKLTEWENMQQNGYDRIWDCGNYVFVYKK